MVELTTLDILYIALTAFVSVIGVLLAIVLVKLIKILWVVQEITDYYYTIKGYFATYAKIPEMIKDKLFEIIKWKKGEEDIDEK